VRIGVDIDGCLANFTDAYTELLTKETGIQFPKASSEWPTEWHFDRSALNEHFVPEMAKAVEKRAWGRIVTSDFWAQLHALPGAIEVLEALRDSGDEVYFITSRPGKHAKALTEYWLRMHGMNNPTVLVVNSEPAKGHIAKGLQLEAFIDDKPENCIEVRNATMKMVTVETHDAFVDDMEYPCQVFMVDAPYNRHVELPGITRVADVAAALARIEESSNAIAA
jgi:uncharacterized HAD superfamily protein